jgi:vacuolar-type H+-ATPase subunit I/STV1
MPENETQETPETQQTPETLEAIKARLEEERKGREQLEQTIAEKDARIAELEATAAELGQVKAAHTQVIARYLDAVRLANPDIPGDIIAGETIEEIDASVEKARTIADAVRQNLEARAKEARVPAGAPARGEISLEGLTPREKIAAGIQQKGGTS